MAHPIKMKQVENGDEGPIDMSNAFGPRQSRQILRIKWLTICAWFLGFSDVEWRVGFNGGEITSDAGLLLLRQVDRELGLLASIARMHPR